MKSSSIKIFLLNIFFIISICSNFLFGKNILDNNIIINKLSNETENIKTVSIFFGEKLPINILNIESLQETNCQISGPNITKSGIGIILNDFTFDIPGNYEITFEENVNSNQQLNSCKHDLIPNKIYVEVLSYKIKFLFEEITFSNLLIGDKEYNDNILSVPVYYESYNNLDMNISNSKVVTSGVGTNIKGDIILPNTSLKAGKNILKYKLNGKASSNTFIMFDFYGFGNQIFTYYYPIKL